MNTSGHKFINEISERWAHFDGPKPRMSWGDSLVQERIVRLGVESKAYDLSDPNELEQVAVATLREDLMSEKIKDK